MLFRSPTGFDNSCRAAGPIEPPDNMSFEAYIKKALVDELKMGGVYEGISPTTLLTGSVEHLSFSSMQGVAGTSGEWHIQLLINSSNGKSFLVSEHYEFESAFIADFGCKQTADAYLPAVQDLIGKLVTAAEFKLLLIESN